MKTQGDVRGRLSALPRIVYALCLWSLAGIVVPVRATADVAKQREFASEYEAVWTATVAVLQQRGYAIVHSDKTAGIITTDYKIEEDEEWRHKFNILVARGSGDATTISVTCSIENKRQDHSFWASPGLTWENERSRGEREGEFLDAVSRRLQPGGIIREAVESSCRANFTARGSRIRGTTYNTRVELSSTGIDRAVGAISHALMAAGFEVLSADGGTGSLSAIQTMPNGKSRDTEVALSAIGGAVQVDVTQKLRKGDSGDDDAVQVLLCTMLADIGVRLAPASVPITPPKLTNDVLDRDATTIEERLRRLDELYKKGLITEDEYKKKRSELLAKL